MSLTRKAAVMLLRRMSTGGEEWATAMLRELDYIQGDWAALRWALGGTTAIWRQRGREWSAGLRANSVHREERTMKDFLKNTAGMVLGVALAVALAMSAYGMLRVSCYFFPSLEMGRVPWAAWIVVFAIPEAIFVVGAKKLWRKQRPMAVGIAVSAAIFVTHFIMHVASHWDGQ